jgi:membrane protein
MATEPRANTPLWLDLLLTSGMIGVAYGLERTLRPRRPERSHPRGNGRDLPGEGDKREESHATRQVFGQGREDDEAPDGEAPDNEGGAMGVRPSQEPESLQRSRAWDRDRGREADQPHQIPAKGWIDIGWRVFNQIQNDRLLAVAAGVVFYMLLALFPAITALVSLYGLFTDPSTITAQLSLLEGVLPVSTIGIIEDRVTQLADTSSNALSFGFLFGVGLALWSANAGMKAIIDALNVVYDEREKRSFVWLTLVAFAFTIGGLVFIILALAAVVVLPLVLAWFGLESRAAQIVSLLRWPVLLIVILVWLTVLYRYGPSRTRARWQWLGAGSVFATIAWLAGSVLFSWYLSNFANYDATYGSLGAGIGLMMWLWLSVIVVLVGGELNAEMEHQTARDTTVRPDKPMGERGAVVADTVGEAWR